MNKVNGWILAGGTMVGLFDSGVSLSAQLNKSPDSHPLTVRIDANDNELNNLVKSYVARELRSLKDVTINEAPQPTFVIGCICMPTKINGTKVGYAVSFVVTSNLKPLKYIAAQFKTALDKSPEGIG